MKQALKLVVSSDRLDGFEKDIVRLTESMTGNRRGPEEFIRSRRTMLLIHSFLYYTANSPVISDNTWQSYANELVILQDTYPELCKIGFYDEAFVDWDSSTGMHLPSDEWVIEQAKVQHLQYSGYKLEYTP